MKLSDREIVNGMLSNDPEIIQYFWFEQCMLSGPMIPCCNAVQSFDMQDEKWESYISVWNKGEIVVSCLYNGEVKNFHKDEFSPFFKRLQRFGI
jgi:hypothetical protein